MERSKVTDDKLEKGESNTSSLTRNTKAFQEIESVNRVFGNPLLMDKIVKWSIYNSNGKQINKQTIVDLRLLNKTWLQSTSRVLAKSGERTINLIIGCLDGVYIKEEMPLKIAKETNLNEFLSVFSKASRSYGSILPICFTIQPLYLIKENTDHLSNFLEQCSDIICRISVIYPINGESMNLNCTDIKFDILQDLNFAFINPRSKDDFSESTANGLQFFQQILQNSPSLQRIILLDDDKVAINASSIILPATLKSLKFGQDPVTENEFTLFARNPLPNLNTMDLEIDKQTDINLAYKVLEHFQHQLKTLSMNLITIDDDLNESVIYIKLPVMKKLKSLKLSGEDYALYPELRHGWPKLVPNLNCLVLKNLSETLFLEWVQGSRFENVNKFKFSLKYNNDDGDDDDECPETLSPNVQILKEIVISFPKIEKLTLKYMLGEISSLEYLFKNLTQLKKLNLKFKREDSGCLPGYKLVQIFLGIPMKLATHLIDKTVKDVRIAVDNPKSIMNLTELKSLTLKAPKYYFPSAKEEFYSEIISKYGLSKMPKLQKIKLLGGFEQQQ